MSRTVAICAILKDEHQYLKEWIDHHLSIGIDEIYLFEDVDSKPHIDIVKDYNNVYLKSIGDFINLKFVFDKQEDTYNRFIHTYKNKVDYVFFIDLDEFVIFEDGYNLDDLIQICDSKSGALYIPWKYYGANGIVDNPKTPLMTTYTKPSNAKCPNKSCQGLYIYKTFCNIRRGYMRDVHVHYNGEPIVPFDSENIHQVCWLNHYITKSWEEWCNRLFNRGQNPILLRKLDEFFEYNPDMIVIKEELYNKEYCKNKELLVGHK